MPKFMKRALLAGLFVYAMNAFAADRHVFLDTDGDGVLNQCPNPAHNTYNTASTGNLQYCVNGTAAGKMIGDKAGKNYVADVAGVCGVGGTTTNVTNGISADIDSDGTNEALYLSPQVCIYNFALNDTCEVHAGTYKKPGARAGQTLVNAADGLAGCARTECWNASFVALGSGPNMGANPGTGYGASAASPGYLRGAVMNSSTDNWDTNANKVPDNEEGTCAGGVFVGLKCTQGGTECTGSTCASAGVSGYPAVISGDSDEDSVYWEQTECSGATTCVGDAFYAGIIGCGRTSPEFICPAAIGGGQHRIYLDKNGDGTFAAGDELSAAEGGALWNSSYLTIKDIEFRDFNGGPTTCVPNTGDRDFIGAFSIGSGDTGTTSAGFTLDHVYWHRGFYSRFCTDESLTAFLGDQFNNKTAVPTVIANSYIISGNRFVINDDCGEYGECGGSKTIHDNRIVFPATRADGASWSNGPVGASSSGEYQFLFRLKSIDSVTGGAAAKVVRAYNNEIIWERASNSGKTGQIYYNECVGQCFHAERDVCDGGTQDGLGCSGQGSVCGVGGICGGLCAVPGADPEVGDPCHPLGAACGAGGTCGGFWGTGKGELWFYGNLLRLHGAGATFGRFADPFCSISQADCPGCQNIGVPDNGWKWYNFNNTNDLERPSGGTSGYDYICNNKGEISDVKNNAYYGVGGGNVITEDATTKRHTNNTCSASFQTDCPMNSTGRTGWWTVGLLNVPVHAGIANYIPKPGGPLAMGGTCDPDGNGVAGVNYDGLSTTGVGGEETSWTGIDGRLINCTSIAQAIDGGAIQFAAALCGNNIKEGSEICDGTDTNNQSCATQGYWPGTPGTLSCLGDCSGFDTSTCQAYIRSRISVLSGWFKGIWRGAVSGP